jgi:hypothetical protein
MLHVSPLPSHLDIRCAICCCLKAIEQLVEFQASRQLDEPLPAAVETAAGAISLAIFHLYRSTDVFSSADCHNCNDLNQEDCNAIA